mgnify:CR=1 FL=1
MHRAGLGALLDNPQGNPSLGALLDTPENREAFVKRIEAYASQFRAVEEYAHLWAIVMIVTAAEAYLQDALAFNALHDPSLMKDSALTATYDDIVEASTTAKLASVMRSRWARAFVDRGGPPLWILRLSRMGAGPYPDAMPEQLDLIWGIRHVVVHSAGVAGPDFCRLNPDHPSEEGHPLSVDFDQLHEFGDQVRAFVRITDQYCAGRNRAKRPTPGSGA